MHRCFNGEMMFPNITQKRMYEKKTDIKMRFVVKNLEIIDRNITYLYNMRRMGLWESFVSHRRFRTSLSFVSNRD